MDTHILVLILKKKKIEKNIIRYIITSHNLSKKKQIYEKFEEFIKSISSQRLYVTSEFNNYVFNIIFKDENVIKYILSKNKIFNKYYKKEFIDNNKTFKLMTQNESFLYSILYELYH